MIKKCTRLFSGLLIAGFLFFSTSVFAQLNGNYTIGGTGANYATVVAAVSALTANGVSGPVKFTVAAGTYTGQIQIGAISGASSTNTITFDGVNKADRILSYSGSSSSDRATLVFNACSYITFKNFTIESTNTSYALGVYFAPSSKYNTVTGCDIKAPENISSTYIGGVLASGNQASYYTSGSDIAYNEVSYCYITGGYFTVVFYGTSASGGTYSNTGNKFNYNTVDYGYYYKIYWYYQGQYEVIGNKLTTKCGSTTFYPMYFYYCAQGKINENFVNSGYCGIMSYYENYSSGTTSLITQIYNNMIMNSANSSYHMGLYMYYNHNLEIYHNSIWINPQQNSISYAAMYNYYSYYPKIKNNIFANTGNGGAVYMYTPSYSSGDIDYNNYYSLGPNFVYHNNTFANLTAYQSSYTTINQNSYTQTPHFTDYANLHYSFGTVPKFVPYMSQVPKDIDLENRKTSTTMAGADEQEFPDYDLDIIAITDPVVPAVGNNTIVMQFVNSGSKPIPAQTIYFSYQINGGSWVNGNYTLTSALQPYTTPITHTFTTPWYIPAAGTYTICVRNSPQITGDPDASDQKCVTACTGFKGSYTIDAAGGGNFLNFQDALAQMQNCGVSGPVYFTVKPGTYPAFQINAIKGTSATNDIKFIGEDKARVIIQHAGSASNNGLQANIRLNGADYITLANMTVINTGTSYGEGIHLINKSDYNTFKNIDITVAANNTTYILPLVGSGSFTSYSSQADWGNYNTFSYVTTKKGYFGVVMYGATNGNTYDHMTVEDVYYYGMYMYYSTKMKIQYCKIRQFVSNSGYGMLIYYGNGDTIIGNYIEPGAYGIMSYYENYYAQTSRSLYANNMITKFQEPNYQNGIYMYYSYYTNIVNNTIWVHGLQNSYSYAALNMYYYNYNDIVANNILISSAQTPVFSFYYPNSPSGNNIDYNVYNHTGTATFYFYLYGTGYTFTNFKARTAELGVHDQNSWWQVDAQIVGQNDMHLVKGSLGRVGMLIPGNKYDFDGDRRCDLVNFVGADEPAWKVSKSDFVYYDTMCRQSPVTFYNTGIEKDPHQTSWFVKNQFKSNSFHFTTTIPNVGFDTITLVQKTCASIDTITKRIYFDDPKTTPTAEFMVTKNVLEVNEPTYLGDLSTGCPSEWQWDIQPAKKLNPLTNKIEDTYVLTDNTTLTSPNLKLYFRFSGQYDISLTPKNSLGTGQKMTKTAYINVKFSDNMCGPNTVVDQPFGVIYDDGGQTGNHGASKKCEYLIIACGNTVDVTVSDFNIPGGAYLRLYDGANNQGTPIWNPAYGPKGMTGNMNDPKFYSNFQVTKTGMLFVEFESDVATGPGFKIEWAASGKGNFQKPVASFDCADTGCITLPFLYQNTSLGGSTATSFKWDYDGNGIIDSRNYNGSFSTMFQGLAATYKTLLYAQSCGGIDTFEKIIVLINPQSAPVGDIAADITAPVVGQDIVTLRTETELLSCVNTFEWTITPSTYYYEAGTNKNSMYPKIVFSDTGCYDVTVIMGNSNTAWTTTKTRTCYIKPKTYCNPVVMNQHNDMGIGRVICGTIDNTSSVGVTGYNNFTNIASTNLYMGQKYYLTLERPTNFNTLKVKVWIDWNNDGDLDDPGEEVAGGTNFSGLSWTDSFLVPPTADLGATMMRISATYGSYPNTPCGPHQFGEVEDYRVFVSPDNVPPQIVFKGNNPEYVEIGYTYNDAGADGIDNIMGNITNYVFKGKPLFTTTNMVSTDQMGTYFVFYNACDTLWNCGEDRRIVYVTEDKTPPVITLMGGDTIYVSVNKLFNDTFYHAHDLADGDITNKVQISGNLDVYKLGTYVRDYYVEDAAGLSAMAHRTLIVVDNAAPDITLNGSNPMYLEIMKTFNDPGATYSDNYWPNNKIVYAVTGLVDNTKVGTYTITYQVTDYSGNGPNTITRNVIVWDSTAPTITAMGGDVIEHEVLTQFVDPGLNITDNSISGFTINRWGSFLTKFPNEFPDQLGNYIIFYTAKDAAGNQSDILGRIVKVSDTKAPILTLKGNPYMMIERWDNFVDPGYTVSDNFYKVSDITVTVDDNVNVHYDGLYHVCYQAKDPSGNVTSQVCRIVKVWYNENTNSVKDNSDSKVVVYPNPTLGNVTVNIDLPVSSNVFVSITDMMGKELMVLNRGELKSSSFDVDLSNFSSGVYFIKVQTDTNTYLEKIIRN